jgi:hypothetical protein
MKVNKNDFSSHGSSTPKTIINEDALYEYETRVLEHINKKSLIDVN